MQAQRGTRAGDLEGGRLRPDASAEAPGKAPVKWYLGACRVTTSQPQVIHVWPEDDKPNLICKNVIRIPDWLVRAAGLDEDVDLNPEASAGLADLLSYPRP